MYYFHLLSRFPIFIHLTPTTTATEVRQGRERVAVGGATEFSLSHPCRTRVAPICRSLLIHIKGLNPNCDRKTPFVPSMGQMTQHTLSHPPLILDEQKEK